MQPLASVGHAVYCGAFPSSQAGPVFHIDREGCGAAMLLETPVQVNREADLKSSRVMLRFKLNEIEVANVVRQLSSGAPIRWSRLVGRALKLRLDQTRFSQRDGRNHLIAAAGLSALSGRNA